MFDPFPSQDLPEVEFIELYNPGTHDIFIDKWKLNDATLSGIHLMPDEHIIICKKDHELLFEKYGKTTGILPWDMLNNEGQSIILKDNLDNVVDSVFYTPGIILDTNKRKGGWSIELINPTQICKGKFNWTVSIDVEGGTPGQQNSTFSTDPDTTRPTIQKHSWIGEDTLQLMFSEPMGKISREQIKSFKFLPAIPLLDVFIDKTDHDVYYIITQIAVKKGVNYQLSITNLSDCMGNRIRDTLLFTGIGIPPSFLDLLITEIMIDEIPSVGLPESEYFEIYNASDYLISLKGTRLLTHKDTFYLKEILVLPGHYLVVCPENQVESFGDNLEIFGMKPFPRLLNNGQPLAMFNTERNLIFSIDYHPDWYHDLEKSEGGYSLEMIDVRNPCGTENNWRASDSPTGGTPGKPNSVSQSNPDRTGPGFNGVYPVNSRLLDIRLSEKIDPSSTTDLRITLDKSHEFRIHSFDSLFYQSFIIELLFPLSLMDPHYIKMEGIKDCVGNTVDNTLNQYTFYLPQEAEYGDLIINEIMFNPRPGGIDWVEVYNKSMKHITLSNIQAGNLTDGKPENIVDISKNQILPPSGFTVITEDKNKVIADFPNSLSDNIIEVSHMPPLPDQFGNIVILMNSDQLLDHFEYSSDFHYELIKNDEGISLERISYFKLTNDTDNWHSASSLVGYGSPTHENSSRIDSRSTFPFIMLEPEVISPDGDGYDDILSINYSTRAPGFSANIGVYDISGQLISSIVNNKLLSTTGTISWNGYTDLGYIPATGIYLIRFEMYNLKGTYHLIKKRFAISKKW